MTALAASGSGCTLAPAYAQRYEQRYCTSICSEMQVFRANSRFCGLFCGVNGGFCAEKGLSGGKLRLVSFRRGGDWSLGLHAASFRCLHAGGAIGGFLAAGRAVSANPHGFAKGACFFALRRGVSDGKGPCPLTPRRAMGPLDTLFAPWSSAFFGLVPRVS